MARREHIPARLRHEVFQRDDYRCRECGATNKETTLEIDHIVPVSKGGTNNINNLQTLCKTCNRAKHTRTWVGGEYNNQNSINTSDYQSINSELYELNRKQRQINSRKYGKNKHAHITRQELYKLNRNQREINSRIYYKKKYEKNTRKHGKKKDKSIKIIVNPKNNLNDKLNKVIDEFKKCNDINIVSKETGIFSSDIKKWYKLGKKGNLVYKEFYEELSKLPPNMSIKKSKIKKDNDKTKIKSVKVSSSYSMLYKKCPKCGEDINIITMSICPNCGIDFNNKSEKIKNTSMVNLPKNDYQSQNKKTSLKLCPNCENQINKILDECPYCKYDFNPNNEDIEDLDNSNKLKNKFIDLLKRI